MNGRPERVGLACRQRLPVFPRKQTYSPHVGMSQKCHNRTSCLASRAHRPVDLLRMIALSFLRSEMTRILIASTDRSSFAAIKVGEALSLISSRRRASSSAVHLDR